MNRMLAVCVYWDSAMLSTLLLISGCNLVASEELLGQYAIQVGTVGVKLLNFSVTLLHQNSLPFALLLK